MKQGNRNMLATEIRRARSRVEQCLTGKLNDLKYISESLTNVIELLEQQEESKD